MSKKNWSTKFPFAAIPMRLLPTAELRRKANRAVVEAIAWDCGSESNQGILMHFTAWTDLLFILCFTGQTLLSGVFPSVDQYGNALSGSRAARAGKQIAGGWKACFESWTGDWKERSLSHAFVCRNYRSTQLCDQCGAIQPHAKTREELLQYDYADFSPTAPWTTTLRDHQQYLAETPAGSRTPWLMLPGFDLGRVRWDTAHTILLGTGRDLGAAFLWDLETLSARSEHVILSVYRAFHKSTFISGAI